MHPELYDGERVDELQFNDLKIIQKESAFRFGTDAVLLADFALIKKRARVADFGAGTGIIAILIAAHNPLSHVDAIELQPDMADMARRSVTMNALTDRVNIIQGDILCAPLLLGRGTYDAVVCNPPYFACESSLAPQTENRRLSRTEAGISIGDICACAFQVLKSGGRLSVVFPAQRMLEMLCAMQEASLAPKRIRTVHGTVNHAAKLVLIDAVKHGGAQLHWLPPLILKTEDGKNTDEWLRIYGQ